jgi:hypothetical protein
LEKKIYNGIRIIKKGAKVLDRRGVQRYDELGWRKFIPAW